MRTHALAAHPVRHRRRHGIGLRAWTAAVTGLVAATGYAGVVGLVGGGLSFGDQIDARLPFDSHLIAGLALLGFVAVPMTLAAVACVRRRADAGLVTAGAGLLLVIWIAVELAFIRAYSFFHPTYLAAAVVVLVLGWLLDRADPETRPVRTPGPLV